MFEISNYRLEHFIASGTQARVYSGFNIQNLKKIAAKQLILSTANPQQHERIIQQIITEFNLLKSTKSSNLVKIYDIIRTNTRLYLIYKQYPTDLQNFLLNNQEIPFQTIQKWSFQIVKGLLDLHFYDIMHRDIKPSNILLTQNSIEGNIKITDFGISKYCSEGVAQSVLGTLGYMAPQIINGQIYGMKADIYSLGKVVYAMLTSDRTTLRGIASTLTFRSDTPEQAKSFVYNCVSKDPKTRLSAYKLGKTGYLKQYKKKIIQSDIFQLDCLSETVIFEQELEQSFVIEEQELQSNIVNQNLRASYQLIQFIEEEKREEIDETRILKSMSHIDAEISFIQEFLTYCYKQDSKTLVYFAVWHLKDKLDSLFLSLAQYNSHDQDRKNILKQLQDSFKRVLENPPKGIRDQQEGYKYAKQMIHIANKRVKYNKIYGLKDYLAAFLEIAVKIQPLNPKIIRRVERLRLALQIY